jgi:hypothetical protein
VAADARQYDEEVWRRNQHMLRFVPWVEVSDAPVLHQA